MSVSTDDESKPTTDDERSAPTWVRTARRYGPFVAVIVVVGLAVALFGGGGDDDDGDDASEAQEAADTDELIASGPMTWERAEAEGVDVDFGPQCDTETGRVMMPSQYAPPCVEPFTGDNGGATSPGVTEDEIKIIRYSPDPALDPLGASMIAGAGADVDPATAEQVVQDYVAVYNEMYESYGREVVIERYVGTGAANDQEAARNDAIAIAEQEPFAVIGGPPQASPVFASELASQRIVCGPGCATALSESLVDQYAPYIWQVGATPEQGAALGAELISNLAGPGPAELAGDPALREQDRVYALVHYDTEDGDYEESFEATVDALADGGIELATDVEFTLDTARMQENARTVIARLEDEGVTTVIYTGDPLTPAALTEEATAQDYYPEWILGQNVLADTTIFARGTDHDQWKNGFGVGFPPARGERSTQEAWRLYEWAYGEPPANNTVGVLDPYLRTIFTGVHMAGPELTPETFRDGLYRAPSAGGGPTTPQVSRGSQGVWPEELWPVDNGGIDDLTVIWFDPDATGEDETGAEGQGMYRYANGGQRYTLGNMPESQEEAGLFDLESSVTVYDEIPESEQVPDYPPPDL
jgi:hypothetical protein